MKKNLFKIVFSLSLFFISTNSFAQQNEYILGKLIDSKTQEPIAFASIRIKDRALGIISNIDGSFKIPIKYKEYGDIIEISSMGYQSKDLLIFDFSRFELNIVRLQPAVLELQEALVVVKAKRKKLTARKIVQKAIERILENYPIEPYSQVGYYRDYQLDDGNYVNLNESILEVFDRGFKVTDSSTTKVLLYDYYENTDFQRDTVSQKPYDYSFKRGAKIIDNGYMPAYGGNEFTILSIHNAIRNYNINSYSFVYKLNTDLLKKHRFSKEDDSSIDDELLYNISFIRELKSYTAYGRLYISKFDYSIYKMEYALYDETKKNTSGLMDENGSIKKLIFKIKTSYRKKGNKMYLNYISFNNLFKLWEPPKMKLEYIDLRFDKSDSIKITQLNNKKRWIVLTFNKVLSPNHVDDINRFSLKFKGNKITLKGFLVVDNQVVLYPKGNSNRQNRILDELELIAIEKGLSEEILQVDVKGVQDLEGNIIGKWTSKDYNQFREFFVQQVKPNSISPVNAEFMKKDTPIFNNQPISKPDNFKEYWMNTPLQNIDQ